MLVDNYFLIYKYILNWITVCHETVKDTWRQFDTQLSFVLLSATERKKMFKIGHGYWLKIKRILSQKVGMLEEATGRVIKSYISSCYGKWLSTWYKGLYMFGCEHYETYQCLCHFTMDFIKSRNQACLRFSYRLWNSKYSNFG